MDSAEIGRLAENLKVLANANRLEILHHVRYPSASSEIRVLARGSDAGESRPDHPISRQAVERHLADLTAARLVRSRRATRDGRAVEEYVLDQANLFALIEDLRQLTALRATAPLDPLATAAMAQPATSRASARVRGDAVPHLLLVAGVGVGRRFLLADAEKESWTIGRAPEADIRLDYDLFVSQEQATLRRVGTRFRIADSPHARNRTTIDFEELPAGGEADLVQGTLIGVGRSSLLVRLP